MNGHWRRLLAAVVLAGCAPLTAVGGKLALSDQGFEVDLPQGWYRVERVGHVHLRTAGFPYEAFLMEKDTDALLITRDGLFLQSIRVERMSVEKDLTHTKRKFAPGMPAVDAAELELDNARSNPVAFNFELRENEPARVGGRPGFRLVYVWKTKDGLRLKRIHYGFLEGKWVYRLIYQAAERHYFDQDLQTFERVRESFRLLTAPA